MPAHFHNDKMKLGRIPQKKLTTSSQGMMLFLMMMTILQDMMLFLMMMTILQDMMLFLNWTRAAILYEDEYGLIRLQELVRY